MKFEKKNIRERTFEIFDQTKIRSLRKSIYSIAHV